MTDAEKNVTDAGAAEQPKLSEADLTKYKTAGEIASKALKKVIEAAKDGASVLELCKLGDRLIEEETGKVYNNKKISKGLAFPTCVNVNNIICHYSPLPSQPNLPNLAASDVVSIQLGAHIDGFASTVAETVVVGHDAANPVKASRAADVVAAAYNAAEAALRKLHVGNENYDVTKVVDQVAAQFGCQGVEGMLSAQHEQNVMDGKKTIVLHPNESNKVDKIKFEEGEVYGIDIHVTTSSDNKPKQDEARTTIYKKTNSTYLLKMKTSRAVFSEIQKKAGPFPFTLRVLEDEKRAKMGVQECVSHGLLTPFDVLYDRADALTAQFFFTVAITKNGPIRLTASPSWYNAEAVQSEKKVEDEELKALLSAPVRVTKKKNKKAKEGEKAEGAEAK